jgi:hypothetical protein
MINLAYLVAAATLAAVVGVAGPSPAAAPTTCTSYGANVACVGMSHHMINWCDQKSDGHRVFAQYYAEESTLVTTGVTGNGSRCRHQSDVRKIVRFRVCEIGSSCSAWRRT